MPRCTLDAFDIKKCNKRMVNRLNMTLDSIEWQSCREKSEVAYCNFFVAAVLPFLFPPYSIQGRKNEIFLGKPTTSFLP